MRVGDEKNKVTSKRLLLSAERRKPERKRYMYEGTKKTEPQRLGAESPRSEQLWLEKGLTKEATVLAGG